MAPLTVPQAFALAFQRHQAGQLGGAEALYRRILAVEPRHAEAWHFLGVVAHQTGRQDLAMELIRKSVAIEPNNAAAYSNLGEACRAGGQLDEAVRCYRRAIELNPQNAPAYYNLGNILRAQGLVEDAAAAYRHAIECKPGDAEAHNNLGLTLAEQGKYGEAIASYRRALELQPGYAEAHINLGNAFQAQRQFDKAIAEYRRALEIKPHFAEAYNNMGNALRDSGLSAEAVGEYRRALELKPDFAQAHHNLGNALRDRDQIDEAMAAYRRAIQIKPDYAQAHYNLGLSLVDRGELSEAIAAYRQALRWKPDYVEAYNNLGLALMEQSQLDLAADAFHQALKLKPDFAEAHNNLGLVFAKRGEADEALAAFRRAIQGDPDSSDLHSNLIYFLHFHPGQDDRTIAEEHVRWNRQFAEPLKQYVLPHTNDRSPSRRLRIGYVSPDFRFQAEAFFVVPFFEAHDHEQFEIHGYASVAHPDEVTARLRRSVDVWHDVRALSHHDLAQQIRADGIDILVDLTMHMAHNRLPVFARQPAPVQVTWLAYPGSTGLETMDYRFTDNHMDPSTVATPCYSEESVRLPDSWCCYHPLTDEPPVNELPAGNAAGITFGCLNNSRKLNEQTVVLFASVLREIEGSRLLLLAPEGSARSRILEQMDRCGVRPERIEFTTDLSRPEYLKLYRGIDIALDPLPYNGITTTCDALWMGVSVVSLAGKTAAGRAGLSILSTVQLSELSARTAEEFVQVAARLASDRAALTALRATLRSRLEMSSLMDAPCFARNVEAAYRAMWKSWCATSVVAV